MTKNIFLIGMPSSGKSTLGRQLAKKLSFEFIDLDARIEAAAGNKVSEIFALHGEIFFRKLESEQLKKIPANAQAVIATGGGVPCFFDNMEYIKKNGISIFLDVSPELLHDRMLASNKNDRPLFNLEEKNLLEQLTEKYQSRVNFYRQADIIIQGDTDADSIVWILEAEFAK